MKTLSIMKLFMRQTLMIRNIAGRLLTYSVVSGKVCDRNQNKNNGFKEESNILHLS